MRPVPGLRVVNGTETQLLMTLNLVQRLVSILDNSRLVLENGADVVVEDSRHWIRRLPIGAAESRENC